MNNRLLAASVLSTAVGLALAVPAPSVRAQGANPPQIVKDNMARMAKDNWDNDVPPLDVLLGEADHAATLLAAAEPEVRSVDAA